MPRDVRINRIAEQLVIALLQQGFTTGEAIAALELTLEKLHDVITTLPLSALLEAYGLQASKPNDNLEH